MSVNKYYNLAKKVFLINRSITGKGTHKTLKIFSKEINNFKIKKFSSGKKVFDWKIPDEWNIDDAYVMDKNKKKIINLKDSNLHIIGYSVRVNKRIKKNELIKKLFSLKDYKNAIPYITSYYKKNWGFCITENQKQLIKKKYNSNDLFKVKIDSSFKKKGKMHYGELFIKGKTKKEILISTYICHPSMANNELSGPVVALSLISYFSKLKNKYSIRFLFLPETIGSIAYLSSNLMKLKKNVIGGYNLTCIGDEKNHSYILSKYGNSPSDFALLEAYKRLKIRKKKEYSFLDRGSDERQYNSPGIDLKITSVFRTKFNEFKEYHTSLDNFKIMTLKGVRGGYNVVKKAILILQNQSFPKTKILCEPFLSKKNLYPTLSTKKKLGPEVKKITNFIQYSDGNNSLEKISKIINININETRKIYKILLEKKIVQ